MSSSLATLEACAVQSCSARATRSCVDAHFCEGVGVAFIAAVPGAREGVAAAATRSLRREPRAPATPLARVLAGVISALAPRPEVPVLWRLRGVITPFDIASLRSREGVAVLVKEKEEEEEEEEEASTPAPMAHAAMPFASPRPLAGWSAWVGLEMGPEIGRASGAVACAVRARVEASGL